MKNKNTENRINEANNRNGMNSVRTVRRAGLWRTAVICILFMLTVLTAVFGISGFKFWNNEASDNAETTTAYAANANSANQTAWLAAITAKGNAANYAKVTLAGDWIAEVKDSTNATTFRTEFGTGNSNAYYKPSSTDYRYGGALRVPSGWYIELDLAGHTIDRNVSSLGKAMTQGGFVIYVQGYLKITDSVGGGKITGGWNSYSSSNGSYMGAGVAVNGGHVEMYGGSITGNKSSWGGAVTLTGSSTFDMYGGKITDNTCYLASGDPRNVGGVYNNGTSFTMHNGEISNNKCLCDGASTKTTHGTGGIFTHGSSTTTIKGGKITGNVGMGKQQGAGGIDATNGTNTTPKVYLLGGEISGNIGYISGGVRSNTSSKFYVGGTIVIKDNYVQDEYNSSSPKYPNDLDLYCGRQGTGIAKSIRTNVIAVSEKLLPGAEIHVVKYTDNYVSTPIASMTWAAITSGYGAANGNDDPTQFFKPSNPDHYWIDPDNKRVTTSAGSEVRWTNKLDILNWQNAVLASTATTGTMTVKLNADIIAVGGKFVAPAELTADANGKMFTDHNEGYNSTSDLWLKVPAAKSIVLDLNGHTIDRGLTAATAVQTTGHVIKVDGGTMELTDTSAAQTGKITGGYNINSSATTAGNGGGIHVSSSGTFTLSGGIIEDNYANQGAGIYINTGTVNINGGIVRNNTAITRSDGTLGNGGGINAVDAGKADININGGEISGNHALKGGGVYLGGTTTAKQAALRLTMLGGKIINNVAETEAGGIGFGFKNNYFAIGDNPVIEGNTANGAANDVHLPSVKLTDTDKIDNGLITIVKPLTTTKKIGVYRDILFTITSGYPANNGTANPANYFTAQKPGCFIDTDETTGEAVMVSAHGADNWSTAVTMSKILNGKLYTVKLTEDWTAVDNATANFGTSFLGDEEADTSTAATNPYWYGSLNVVTGSAIVLDLNGHTLDRGLSDYSVGMMYGNVINIVGGTLYIKDSSTARTGTITGGFVSNNKGLYTGGAITLTNASSTLVVQGGNITGNRSNATDSKGTTMFGAGAIGIQVAGGRVTVTGGTITNNLGNFAGGIGMVSLKSGTLSLGGNPRILNNFQSDDCQEFGVGNPSDIYNPSATAGSTVAHMNDGANYKIEIISPLTSPAKIGIHRPDTNNITLETTNGNIFTRGYGTYNTQPASDFFFSSDTSYGIILEYGLGAAKEATYWIRSAAKNWSDAVNAGRDAVTGQPITVKLYENWIAVDGVFGTGTGFTATGALDLPKSNIILDLNGFRLDRALDSSIEHGYVLNTSGTCRLEIRDSVGGGIITGGYNSTEGEAGGINITSATTYLSIYGGKITDNIGDAGGIATFVDTTFTKANYFAMGGSAVVTGNKNTFDKPLNINLRAKYAQVITFDRTESQLTSPEKSGIYFEASSDFTNGFAHYHTDGAAAHFVADDPDRFVIDSGAETGEAALYTWDNYTNWYNAVTESVKLGTQRKVTLVSHWTADTMGRFGDASDNQSLTNGALWTNAANIILDLAGYTIDRALGSGIDNGFVILIADGGTLKLIDSVGGGKITGGNNTFTSSDDYVGGGINNRGKFIMEGGIITGNRAVGHALSTGGVYTDTHANNTFIMTGGVITDNTGSFTGGVNVSGAAKVYLGGKAQIYGNKLLSGAPSDVLNNGGTVANKINVYSQFESGARIAVAYVGNNYGNLDNNVFTSSFASLNKTIEPKDVFEASDPLKYVIGKRDLGSGIEGMLICIDNEQNWRQGIAATSTAAAPITVTLNRDWLAEDYTTFVTAFGTQTAAYSNGGLNVPAGKYIILDLAGHKLDRRLTTPRTMGYVINVIGNLTVIDSSASKSGVITGGYSTDTGGGITYRDKDATGALTLLGGKITGNIGIAGGVEIARSDNKVLPFSFGDSAIVTGNTNNRLLASDIVANNAVQMIDIISPLTQKGRGLTGFTRDGVGDFTTNFKKFMPSEVPTDFFTSTDPMYVYNFENGEGALYTSSNQLNWLYAVKASVTGNKKQITFKLVDDWLSDAGSFGVDSTVNAFYAANGGALRVPANANIVLDLAGCTLDRGFRAAVDLGYVIRVEGMLKIIDSSTTGKGVITGGFNNSESTNEYDQSSVIAILGNGAVTMEGGTIKGNRATGKQSAAIVLDLTTTTFTMTGGTITENYGGPKDAHTGAGAINLRTSLTLKLGGSAKIFGNKHNFGEYSSDVHFNAANYYVEIVQKFNKSANIGISPNDKVNNYNNATKGKGGVQFTKNFSNFHPDADDTPDRYFFGSWYLWHDVTTIYLDTGREGAFWCMENYTNWVNAVAASSATTTITFELTDNWTAESSEKYGTTFHPSDTSAFKNGAIYLPAKKSIILDLKGFTIDRGLFDGAAVDNGAVITILGNLEIIDSVGGGMIVGGNNKNGGGGIIVDSTGVLTVHGGTITENKGTEGAGIHVIKGGKLTLGGAIDIYGNTDASNAPKNVYIAVKDALINVDKQLVPTQVIGVTRLGNGTVTSGFQTYMPGNSPLECFKSENDNYYGIEGGDGELFFLSPDNFTNWQYAVDQSVKTGGKLQTVRLTDHWTADGDASLGTSFGSGTGFSNGALYVPETANIELDLNGKTINRNITSARQYGLVFVVLGKLTIYDSAEKDENNKAIITGGKNDRNNTNFYAGGIHVGGKATLKMLGGTVSGNWNASTSTNSASGVYVVKGGTFMLQDAAVINNQSTYAGVYIEDGAMFSVSGKAVVEGNKSGAGVQKDVVFGVKTGVMGVTDTLTEGAHIGVYKSVNNYADGSLGGSKITSNYSRYNSEPASTFFFASDDPFHKVIDLTSGGATEAALYCYDNATNWKNAVTYSTTSKTEVTFKLFGEWVATRNNETTSFGSDTTAFTKGALRVPASAQIVLDLNDGLINRDLPRANDDGYVIYVEGKLSIIDTSTGGSGMIAGGWTTGTSINDAKYASGIHVVSKGKLSMEGGAVSDNNGVGVYLAGNNTFSLGGKTRITGNQFSNGNVTNLYLHNETQMINIISEFGSSAQFGVMRAKGSSNFGSGTLTTNYSKYNKTVEPTTYFTSDDNRYMIVDEGYLDDASMEAAFIGKDNLTNWAHAVKTSLANGGRAQVCTLFEDWTADTHGTFTKSFGDISGLSAFYRGALYVPAKCHVILDLNGHIIDRALVSPIKDGEVIYVRGTLVIKDSDPDQKGRITGGFTDGNSTSYSNGRAGGIAVYQGTLSIEGGTITGNKAKNFAGGVYLSGGSTFSMLGGKITGNYGKDYGGVYVDGSATVRLGGSAYIHGNKQLDNLNAVVDQESNVYIQTNTNKLFISDNFREDARIGVSVNVNHVPAAGRYITKDWNLLNNEYEATTVFSTDHPESYSLADYNQDGTHEALMTLRDNKLNWANTVKASQDLKKTQTFVLYDDWRATQTSASSTSFGSGTGYNGGELFVPTNASIIFDLNGNTIDRGYHGRVEGISEGAVFHVEGELIIIDSKAKTDRNGNIVQGKITGGYRGTYGGAICACKGKVTILAGLITDNRSGGAGAISITGGKLALGGTVQFSDNYLTNGRREDITFWSNTSPLIEIASAFVTGEDVTKNDIFVKRNIIGEFTKDWGKYNPTSKPETRFKAAVNTYRVASTGTGAQREAVMLSNNNNDNWVFAVTASLSNKEPQYFSLVDNWTAANYSGGSYTTRFGTNSTAYRSGALLVPAGANIVLDLNGNVLDRNHGLANDIKYPAINVVIIVEGTLQIVDSSIMQTGVIKGGSYGVYVNKDTASLTVGGLIKPDGLVLNGDEANLYGTYGAGTITSNSIYGINVNAGSLTVTGGKITGNTNADVFVSKNTAASVSVGDNAYIYTENRTAGTGLRLENPLGIINVASKLTNDAKIGFSRQSVGQLTKGWGAKNGNDADPYASIFVSEEPAIYNRKTEVFDGYTELSVSSFDNAVNWQFTVDKSLATGEAQEFTLYGCWTAAADEELTTSFGSGTAFRNGALYVPEGAKVTLNLNGHKINRNLKTSVQNGMVIYADGELEIVNNKVDNPAGLIPPTCCDRSEGVITGGANLTGSSGGALHIGATGSVTLTDGKISNNKGESQSASAGAVYSAGKFFMNGGTISSNTAKYSGAVYVAGSGMFVMTGGTIESNTAESGGGAVYTTGTVNFTGGTITKNYAVIGGVYVASNGKFTMDGDALITANTGSSAGAVFVNSGSGTYFTMNGGTISNNKAIGAGGIYSAGKTDILGGTITGNTATGTSENDGGGAIYVTSTGNVTVTGGEITANTGENGIRVYGAGTMSVGGSARIYNNIAMDKTNVGGDREVEPNDYCDIFFNLATKKLNVVSEFTEEAKIGIYRLNAGIFTSGFGMYNDVHPNTVFVSNRSIFAISKTASDDVTNIEASIGTPVDPEPNALETPRTYNGNWQSIIENIDLSMMTIGEYDTTVMRESVGSDGLVKIEAVNAGTYHVAFTLKDTYCWKDGTTDVKVIYTTVTPKTVALKWSKETHYVDGNPVLDDLGIDPICVYDGTTEHKPFVEVAAGYLVTNAITGKLDECTVAISGATKDASGPDGHTAKATGLSNSNYKLGTGAEVEYKFHVLKAERPEFEITTTTAAYNYPTKIEVSGNLENGKLTYEVDASCKSFASFNENGELIAKKYDPDTPVIVKIKVTAGESKNYKQSEATAEITVVRGKLYATIVPAEVTFGTSVQLTLEGEFSATDIIGAIKYTKSLTGDGQASLSESGLFTATGVGKVYVTATVEESVDYEATTIEAVIEIIPKVLTVNWGTSLTTPYSGSPQTLAAPTLEGTNSSDNCTVSVYKAGFLGWDSKKQAPTWSEVGKYDVGLVLSDPVNYKLENDSDYFATFEIVKADLTEDVFKFTSYSASVGVPFKPEVTGNPAGSNVKITKESDTIRGNYDLDRTTGEYTAYTTGTMTFKAVFEGDKNYNPKTIWGVFTIAETDIPLEISPSELTYGDPATEIKLSYKNPNDPNPIPATATATVISLDSSYNAIAELVEIDGKKCILPKAAGTIKIHVEHPAASPYKQTSVDLEVVIKPLPVKVDWTFDTNGYIYNGTAQYPTATITGTLVGSDLCGVTGYEAYQLKDGEYVKVEGGAINAGDYKIKAIFDNANYVIDEDYSANLTIKPLPVDLSWSNTNLVYNGKEQAPTAGVFNIVIIDGEMDECTVTVVGTKNAGTNLTARATELSNPNYTLEGGKNLTEKFTITPKSVTVTWGETDLVYTGERQAPKATAVGLLGKADGLEEDDTTEVVVTGEQVNVNPADNPYTATASSLSNHNYQLDPDVYHTTQFNIVKATPTITLKQTEAIYGTQFILQIDGNAGNGTVTYSLGEGDGVTATLGSGNLLTPIDVGSIEVIVSVAATQNYNGVTEQKYTLPIKPRPIEVSWDDLVFDYDKNPHNPTATVTNQVGGEVLELTLSAAQTNAGTYTATVTGIKLLGDLTNKYTLEGGTDISQEFVINKKVVTITWSNTEFTYDGDDHAPTATIGDLEDGDTCTATVKGAKDAGMNIVAEITELSNSNYTVEGAANETVRFNIYQRLAKLSWSDTELPYTGSEQLPTVEITNLVEGDECTVNLDGAAVDVGTHTATAISLSNPNYTLVFDDDETDPEKRTQIECEFEIVKGKITIELVDDEVTFGSEITLSLVENPSGNDPTFAIVTGGTGSGSITDGTTFKATGAGTVKVSVHVASSANYDEADDEVEVTVKKLPVVIEWVDGEFTYNRTKQTPTASVSNVVDGYPCNVTAIDGSTDAGENLEAKVTAVDNDNYTIEGGTNITTNYAIQPLPVTMITWDSDRTYEYNGDSQGPNATASGIIYPDECKVTVSGWQTNVGDYTAEITGLSNSNYSLVGIVDLTVDFKIVISTPTLTLKTTEVQIGTTKKIEVEGNIGNGDMTYTIVSGGDYGELNGDSLYGKMLGTVRIRVDVAATSNTNAAYVEGDINVVKGQPPLKLERNTVMYGSTLTLTVDDNGGALRDGNGDLMFGNVTFTVVSRYANVAEIVDGNVLKPKSAGTVYVKMETEETDYFDAAKGNNAVTVEITITPRIITLGWKDGTFTYNAKDQHPEVEITNIVGNDKVELVVSGGKNVGDHTAKVTGLTGVDSKNYTLDRTTNKEKDFHINPYVLSLEWGDLTLPYNGEDQTPEAIVELVDGETAECNVILEVEGPHKNVGTYTVKATGVDNNNYELDQTYETTFQIVPADLKPTLTPASIEYGKTEVLTLGGNIDGAPYDLQVDSSNSVGNGVVNNDNGKWTFTATRVGSVKIKVKINGTTNCNPFNGVLEIEVVKAERNVELLTLEGVYGEDLVLEISGNDDDPGLVSFAPAASDNDYAVIVGNKLTPKHAAYVTVIVQVAATDNYKSATVSAQVHIKPRVVEIEWQHHEFEYDGTEKKPEAKVANLINDDECEVTVGGGGTNAGHYTNAHVISLSNPDYTFEGSISASGHMFDIAKKAIKIEIVTDRINVDDEVKLVITGNEGDAPVTVTVDESGNAKIKEGTTDVIVALNKGSVNVTVSVAESQNYFGDTKTKLIIIDKSKLTLTLKNNTIQYGDKKGLVLDVEGNVENQKVYFDKTDMDGSCHLISDNTVLMPDGAGKVIITATIMETENYAKTVAEFEVTITPIVVDLVWHNFEFTYDGKNMFAPTATVRTGLVTNSEGVTDECTINVKGAQLNVGTYKEGTAYADDECLSNKNYSLGGKVIKAPQFVINRAKLSLSFVTKVITIGVSTKLEIAGNMEFGQTLFAMGEVTDTALLDNLGVAAFDDVMTGMITGTQLGYVHVSVTVMPTDNYEGGQAECDILVDKPEAPIELQVTTVTFGDEVSLNPIVTDNSYALGDFDYFVELDLNKVAKNTGEALVSGLAAFKAMKVGIVYVNLHVDATDDFRETDKSIPITIVPRVLGFVWDTDTEFEYNGEEQHPDVVGFTNLVFDPDINDGDITLEYEGSIYASEEATATITALNNENYTLEGSTTATTTFVINPRKVILSWTIGELIYNGEKQAPEATVTNRVKNDVVHVTVDGQIDAGENLTAEAVAVSNSNYTVDGGTNITTTFEIKPYAVNIHWGDLHLTYTGTVNVPTATAVGLKGEVVNVTVEGVGEDTGSCVHASNKPYQAQATGISGNTNYTLNTAGSVVTTRNSIRKMDVSTPEPLITDYYIDKKELTFSSKVTSVEYNGEAQEPSFIPDVFASDTGNLSISYIFDGGVTPVNVDEYDTYISLGGSASSDYKLSADDMQSFKFKITPKKVQVLVTPMNQTAEYTGEAVKLTDWYTLSIVSGLIGDDIGSSLEDIFTSNNLKINPLFKLSDGSTVSSVGARGTYGLSADLTNVTGKLSGNPNYEAEFKLNTEANATLTISGDAALQLTEDSTFKFLHLDTNEMYGFMFMYRVSYDEKGWVHGKDDTDFERVVLGNILPGTFAGEFLDNINPAQLDSIRLYNYDGELVYDCGKDIGIDDSDLRSDESYLIGTGWKVTYGKDESAADVVYLSVLGDVTGEGYCDGDDMSVITNYVAASNTSSLEDLEFLLAALITNSGYVSASDLSEVGSIGNGYSNVEDFLV